mmetsp:Transcript_110602/g.292006  ORF Transcript_110602/g.292006 Transcript_110602/m.292006 type:complete len:296 (+) Transcript_110602:898-1785(+)
MHEGGKRIDVVRAVRESIIHNSVDELAVGLPLVPVPGQAELEVDRGRALAPQLSVHRGLGDVPPQALHGPLRRHDPGALGQAALSAERALSDSLRVVECLAQDLLLLEALVQMARDQPEGCFPVLGELREELPELLRVHQRLRLVRPLALGERLRKLGRDDAIHHQVVQAVGQLLAHDLMEVAGDLRLPAGRVGAERPDRLVRHVEDGGVVDQDLADGVPILVVALHVFSWECLHPVHQRSLLHEVHRRVKVEAATLLIRQLEMAKVQVGICQAILRACKHASVHKLFLGDAPLG